MRLISYHIRKAHGYLTLRVNFNIELTFLTGINGSGKTTVVRSLVAVLTPSLRSLASFQYEEVTVTLEHENEVTTISAFRDADGVRLRTSRHAEELKYPIYQPVTFEPAPRLGEREADFYRDQEVSLARHPILEFLKSLPTPMFLDLERRGQETPRRARFSVVGTLRRTSASPFGGSLQESLFEAQELAEDAYRRAQADQNDLTEHLRQDIILTAFSFPTSGRTARFRMPPKRYADRLEKNHALVRQTLLALGIPEPEVDNSVTPFFEGLIALVNALPSEAEYRKRIDSGDMDWGLIGRWIAMRPQEAQISRIVRLVDQYNATSVNIQQPIQSYLTLVNRFLVDSRKELQFMKRANLAVSIEGSSPRGIGSLSSGERQIVVILTHLAFNPQARQANVLMIDEPELSLHVHWQEIFVSALLEAGHKVQFILATHSPSIILDRTHACVDMTEARE